VEKAGHELGQASSGEPAHFSGALPVGEPSDFQIRV